VLLFKEALAIHRQKPELNHGIKVSASITKIEISLFDDENFLIFPDFPPGFPDISLNF
jgi:hypothetical protein